MLGYQSSADWAVPVFVRLCLSLLRCACPYRAVPVFVTLCLSLLGCACLCSAVPVRVGLCLSLLGCACLCYAVPNRVQLCWPLRVPLLFRNRILTLIPLYNIRPSFILRASPSPRSRCWWKRVCIDDLLWPIWSSLLSQFLDGPEKCSHPQSRSKITNLMITEHTLLVLFIQGVSDVYTSRYLGTDLLPGNGFASLKSFRGVRAPGCEQSRSHCHRVACWQFMRCAQSQTTSRLKGRTTS